MASNKVGAASWNDFNPLLTSQLEEGNESSCVGGHSLSGSWTSQRSSWHQLDLDVKLW